MSTFSHTDWTVICDYPDCTAQERTDTLNFSMHKSTATNVRKVLKRRGWAVAVFIGRERRADFCPAHKAAGMALVEESR